MIQRSSFRGIPYHRIILRQTHSSDTLQIQSLMRIPADLSDHIQISSQASFAYLTEEGSSVKMRKMKHLLQASREVGRLQKQQYQKSEVS